MRQGIVGECRGMPGNMGVQSAREMPGEHMEVGVKCQGNGGECTAMPGECMVVGAKCLGTAGECQRNIQERMESARGMQGKAGG